MAAGAAVVAAAAAAAAASQSARAAGPREPVTPPELTPFLGGPVVVSITGGVNDSAIDGTLLAVDAEWLVLRGRNGNHFLIPVQRLLSILIPERPATNLPRAL